MEWFRPKWSYLEDNSKYFFKCVYFWLCWVFVATQAALWLWRSGFPLRWLLLLWSAGSQVTSRLKDRLNIHGAWA